MQKQRRDLFTKNKDIIVQKLSNHKILTTEQLSSYLEKFKENNLVTKNLYYSKFLLKLIDLGLQQHTVLIKGVSKTRYTFDTNLDSYAFVNSFEKYGFFSMSTALNIQGFTNFNKDFIFYSNEQQAKDYYRKDENLSQKSIDNAFSKEYRYTHKRVKYMDKSIVILNPKHTNEIGVIDFKEYRVSSINRVFVEMIVNLQYFKSYNTILDVFQALKNELNIDEIFHIIQEFKFIYPYFQLFGFTLEKLGYKRNELFKFSNEIEDLKFYTQKNLEKYTLDEYWNIYY